MKREITFRVAPWKTMVTPRQADIDSLLERTYEARVRNYNANKRADQRTGDGSGKGTGLDGRSAQGLSQSVLQEQIRGLGECLECLSESPVGERTGSDPDRERNRPWGSGEHDADALEWAMGA